ncbi:Alpha/Beta hydrolase protein [Colletotrichum godetiae]|uniref:Alpha/Beta hydrolase protein n=1 Tax=Colletotrichum godetiae TaxID=1209918 RepID=A0AAJ0B167_9PEZI|nr:Alpha/Beta hydrolase protein [Colletotrichum godetiae]KAK1700553.1 Alpha/Beta hydrolase protein [Colletotrichum godetiae]
MEVITLLQGDEDSHLTPFFMCHAISGLALPFLRLEALSEDDERPVYGITSPMHCPGGDDFEFPETLRDLAALYVDKIKEIQPMGPYLLGGWSMGGMIAMNMAVVLRDQGEKVTKVIMLDSANPETFPSFPSAKDHRSLTHLTFTRTVAADIRLMDSDSSPIGSPVISESEFGDYLTPSENRTSTWGTFTTEVSYSSSASSDYEDDSPAWSPSTPGSPACSSDAGSEYCPEQNRMLEDFPTATEDQIDAEILTAAHELEVTRHDDEEESENDEDADQYEELDDDNEPDQVRDFLQKIKKHIHKGLGLISTVEPGQLLPKDGVSDFHTVLIKCKPDPFDDPNLTQREREGVIFVRSVMREKAMCWEADKFAKFETVPFSGDHDGAFEPQHVGELSGIFRKCLQGLE